MQRRFVNRMLEAKEKKGLSFEDIAVALDRSPEWTAALLFGEATADESEARELQRLLDLDDQVASCIQKPPMRGRLLDDIPRDPLLYRFHEVLMVYGPAVKALIHERYGDGIMSAIDFTLRVSRPSEGNPERVVITLDGKFLSYRKW